MLGRQWKGDCEQGVVLERMITTSAMANICLVSCVSLKSKGPTRASDLYISSWFAKARQYASTRFDKWYILSAEYGLVDPSSVIAPYDKTLCNMARDEKRAWATRVFQKLEQCTRPNDKITVLAGVDYRQHLLPLLTARGNTVHVPMEGLGIGKQLNWLMRQNQASSVRADLDRFYDILGKLEQWLGGKRILAECNGRMTWPERGVYFFFEDGEFRRLQPDQPRVVRVGTHMVSRGSRSTFWHRLHTHRGTENGRGNHRGSIFRLHVGKALMTRMDGDIHVSTWGEGQTASATTRKKERKLERKVSEYIGKMPFLWLTVADSAGPDSDRAYIERNSIGLLSNCCDPIDAPSDNWLGRFSPNEAIRSSGLWNVDHVQHRYDRRLLEVLSIYVDAATGMSPLPERSIAPADWYAASKGKNLRGQMFLFDEGEND
jgi:hypothetical protein